MRSRTGPRRNLPSGSSAQSSASKDKLRRALKVSAFGCSAGTVDVDVDVQTASANYSIDGSAIGAMVSVEGCSERLSHR